MTGHGTQVKRLVLDVLKPHDPPIYDLASKLASCHGVEDVNVTLAEIDQDTESVKVSLDGADIDIDTVKKCVEDLGASVHSFDEVRVVKKPHTK
jgi:hypothetical protein